jgi:hypothetical protein
LIYKKEDAKIVGFFRKRKKQTSSSSSDTGFVAVAILLFLELQ